MEKRYDMLEEQYKIIDNAIDRFKKDLLKELNEKLPMYSDNCRKEMNDIIMNMK